MKNNVRVAKDLLKLAKRLLAEETAYLLLDKDGVNEVDGSKFRSVFASATGKSRVAESVDMDAPRMSKAVFYVSPTVNAVNPPADGPRGWPTRIKNAVATLFNKIGHSRRIYDVMQEGQDKGRGVDGFWPLGCTIQKGEGVYPDNKGKIYRESSYVVTIFGATRQEVDRIATGLKNAFRQESVLVEYAGSTESKYVGF